MKSYLEIHALQSLPPSNVNRDDTGAPKTATYGGVLRARVSSQAWKSAIRRDFNSRLDQQAVGVRTKAIVQMLADEITAQAPELADRAIELAVTAFEVIGLKIKNAKKEGAAQESGSLMFLSKQQLRLLAERTVAAATGGGNVTEALKAVKVRNTIHKEHSIDIALFGRMVADVPYLNADAACQVAHALGVHEVTPEFDYFTAVDDKRREAGEAGAGMIDTVGFNASTLYRYAVINLDQLKANLGSAEAARAAVEEFVRSFVEAMPSGKQNTFANGTRPGAVMVTLGQGQPANLVGAFEVPVRSTDGYLQQASEKLARHAREVFSTWRQPSDVLVCGLPEVAGPLAALERAEQVSFADLVARSAQISLAALES